MPQLIVRLLLGISFLAFPFQLARAEKDAKAVTVGVVLPLTGDAARLGEAVKNGITLGFEALDPALRQKIALVFEDDALIPKNSVSAFNKLVSVNNVDVVITTGSAPSKAVAPLAEQKQIPQLAIASDYEVVAGKKYVVSMWVTPEAETEILIPAVLKRGYRRVARINTANDGTIACRLVFDQENKGRIEIVLDEEYPIEVKDFRTFLLKLKGLKQIDAIFANLYIGQVGIFAKQARELGIHLPLFAYENFGDANEVKISNSALVGQIYASSDTAASDFETLYAQRFPGALSVVAPNAHDLTLLIGAAVRQNPARSAMNAFFHRVRDFKGALGTYSATGDNRFTLPAALWEVTADGSRKLPQ